MFWFTVTIFLKEITRNLFTLILIYLFRSVSRQWHWIFDPQSLWNIFANKVFFVEVDTPKEVASTVKVSNGASATLG